MNPALNATGGIGFIQNFATEQGLTLSNQATSGRGCWNAINAFKGLSFSRPQTLVAVLVSLNDIRRGGSSAKTLKKIQSSYSSIILKGIALSNVAAASGAVTKVGSQSGFAASTYGGVYGSSNGAQISTSNAVESWSWSFVGTSFGVQFIGSDGVAATFGTVQIYIDNVLIDTQNLNASYDGISDGSYDNARGPVAFTYHGYTNTTHTVKVQTVGDGSIALDFFAELNTPANSCSFILGEIPYLDATGYATSPSSGSVSASAAGSNVIKNLAVRYYSLGYTITYAPVNASTPGGLYISNTSSGLSSSDHIHANDTGHSQIDASFTRKIIITYPNLFVGNTKADGSHLYLIYNKSLANVIPATTDFSLSGGKTVTAVSRSGLNNNIIDLTLSASYSSGDIIALSYTPGTNKIQDALGRLAAALVSQSIENFVLSNTKSVTFGASNQVGKSATNPSNLNISNGVSDLSQGFTVVMNMKWVSNSTYQRFLVLGNTGGTSYILEIRTETTSNKISMYLYSSYSTVNIAYSSTSAITASTWQKLIFSYSPSNGCQIYKDNSGLITGTKGAQNVYTFAPSITSSYILSVGGPGDGSLPATTSLVDDVCWITKELNSIERDEYWCGSTSPGNLLNASFSSFIKAYYHFDSNLTDSSSSGYNLTSSSGPTYNSDVP
jgi:hypothetical protein